MVRNQSGINLIEMCVSVGLSGYLILLISGMLSQTMSLSANSQNELIAANAAELLLENARSMTYWELSTFASQTMPIQLLMNTTNASDTLPVFRQIPVQLNLLDDSNIFGTVNPQKDVIDLTGKWIGSNGNYFRGIATESISDAKPITGVPSFKVVVAISYAGAFAGPSSIAYPKTLSREAFVFLDGAHFR